MLQERNGRGAEGLHLDLDFKNGQHAAFPTPQAIEWDGYNYPPATVTVSVLGANEGWRPIDVKQSTGSRARSLEMTTTQLH